MQIVRRRALFCKPMLTCLDRREMPEGTLQLEHLMQATKLLQLKKQTIADIDTCYDVCCKSCHGSFQPSPILTTCDRQGC